MSINNPTMVDYGTSSPWNSWIFFNWVNNIARSSCRDRKTTAGTRNFTKLQNGLWVMSNGFGTRLVFLYCRNFRGKIGIFIFLGGDFPVDCDFCVFTSQFGYLLKLKHTLYTSKLSALPAWRGFVNLSSSMKSPSTRNLPFLSGRPWADRS